MGWKGEQSQCVACVFSFSSLAPNPVDLRIQSRRDALQVERALDLADDAGVVLRRHEAREAHAVLWIICHAKEEFAGVEPVEDFAHGERAAIGEVAGVRTR